MSVFRFLILLFCVAVSSCNVHENDNLEIMFFDMESSQNDDFVGQQYTSKMSGLKSAEQAFSGKYSCKVDSNLPVGIKLELHEIKSGDLVEIAVWVYGKEKESRIVLTSPGSFYKFSNESGETKNGWYKLQLKIVVPQFVQTPVLELRQIGKSVAYFDNLSVKIIKRVVIKQLPNVEHINLIIDNKGLKKLELAKAKALTDKVLTSEKEDWVKAKMKINNKAYKIKLRLKGDWTDHLESDKISYRIKVEDKSYQLNNVFSLQAPQTRGFLYEWIFHKLLKEEEIITTNYEFVYVSVNDELKGVYVKEDHFTQQMLTQQGADSSVILKFNEDDLWEMRKDRQPGTENYTNTYEAAEIESFEKKETLKNNKSEFLKARNKLYNYQLEKESIDSVFSMDKLAKHLAIIDLTRSYHSLIWHNKRFYYSNDGKFELIGYDGFTDYDPYKWVDKPFFGAVINTVTGNAQIRQELNNEAFRKKYLFYLSSYFTKAYLDDFFNKIDEEFNHIVDIVKSEYPGYKYYNKFLYINDSIIKNELANHDYYKLYSRSSWDSIVRNNIISDLPNGFIPVKNVTLKCYKETLNESTNYTIQSFYPKPIKIVAFSSKEKHQDVILNIDKYRDRLYPPTLVYKNSEVYKHIHYTVFGCSTVFKSKIIDLPPPF